MSSGGQPPRSWCWASTGPETRYGRVSRAGGRVLVLGMPASDPALCRELEGRVGPRMAPGLDEAARARRPRSSAAGARAAGNAARRATRRAASHPAAAAVALALLLGPAGAEPAPVPPPAPVFDALLGDARLRAPLAELVAKAALPEGQGIAVRELGRDAASSQHLVAIRDAETPHRHDAHAIAVVLLRGYGSMLIGTETLPVGPGSILYVPRGTRHAFRNTSAEPAVAYVLYLPPLVGSDRVDDPLPGPDPSP